MTQLYYIYLALLLGVSLMGWHRYRLFDKASRVVSLLITATFIAESIAFYAGRVYQNNMPVYSIFNILQLMLLCLYFNYSIDVFINRHIGAWLAVLVLVLGIGNISFLQPLDQFNSYFLIFESVLVIFLCIFAYTRLLFTVEDLRLTTYPHFWFLSIGFAFWSFTLVNWAMYDYFIEQLHGNTHLVNLFIVFINLLTYSGTGIVFYLYPNMIKKQ